MSNFMSNLEKTANDRKQFTENGAVGFRTTGKNLLDLNFKVSSLRSASETEIVDSFLKAYFEDRILALRWLFYARDCREGLGERRLFRVAFKKLAYMDPLVTNALIPVIPVYGRYDDLWTLLEIPHSKKAVIDFVNKQLTEDIENRMKNEPISLLAKWLPSANASSLQTKMYAKHIIKGLHISEKTYRKTLSNLRKYTNVVEVKMSSKNWGEIDYEAVPSRANLVYNSAFLRNDEERRRAFLGALERGEKKINASTLFPHDIVYNYRRSIGVDQTIEALWKNLPDTVKGCGNTIVVADGSGSMCSRVSSTSNVSALEVANALAIYFAERSSGQFKDKYISFSMTPEIVDLSRGKNLYEKLRIAKQYNEVANTNVEAVFDLILTSAVKNKMTQEDLPANILIISDMEFDACASASGGGYWSVNPLTNTLFEEIGKKYEAAGYKMPRLVFWNVCSRTNTIPVKENDLGVALVSGFSVNIAKMVMSNKTDPYECLVETLKAPRYDLVEEVIKDII